MGVMLSKSNGTSASRNPPAYELPQRKSYAFPKSTESGRRRCSGLRVADVDWSKLANILLLISTIVWFAFWRKCHLAIPTCTVDRNSPASTSSRQYTFYTPRGFESWYGGQAITRNNGFLYNDKHAKGEDVAVWTFDYANSEDTWYIYTTDLTGKKQWLSDQNGSPRTTSDTTKRKAVRINVGRYSNKKIKATLVWDDKCLNIDRWHEHTMEAQTNCDEYELWPVNPK